MEVRFSKLFEKDLGSIREKEIISKAEEIVAQLRAADSLLKLHGIKKLKGHKHCYRIRIGSYRLGLLLEGSTVWCARLMTRKEIYRNFP